MDLPLGGYLHCSEFCEGQGHQSSCGQPINSHRAPGTVLGAWHTAANDRLHLYPGEAHRSVRIKGMAHVSDCKGADVSQEWNQGSGAGLES